MKKRIFVLSLCLLLLVSLILPSVASEYSAGVSSDSKLTKAEASTDSTLTREEIKALMRAHAAHKDTCTDPATCPYLTAYRESLVHPYHEPQKAENRTDVAALAVDTLPLPDFVPVPTTVEEANALVLEHGKYHAHSCTEPETCPFEIAYKQFFHVESAYAPASTLTKEEIKNLVVAHRAHEDTCTDPATCPYLTAYRESLIYPHQHTAQAVTSAATDEAVKICNHAQVISLTNKDTDTTILYCPDCLADLTYTVGIVPTKSYYTSASPLALCQHVFGDWEPRNYNIHVRYCLNGCGFFEDGSHSITSADCTHDAECADCGYKGYNWEKAWGHLMEYVADDFAFGTTHTYRCNRRDNDAQPICSYAEATEECSFHEYCDPAVDGQHMRYEICTLCGNWGEIAYDYCRATDGGFCWYCTYGESWS